jgi:hypothetical protein
MLAIAVAVGFSVIALHTIGSLDFQPETADLPRAVVTLYQHKQLNARTIFMNQLYAGLG